MTELLAKYFAGELSEDERREVVAWRNENDKNSEEFFEYAMVWNQTNQDLAIGENRTADVFNSLFNESKETIELPRSKNSLLANITRYAAVAFLVAVSGYFLFSDRLNLFEVEVTTGSGVATTIELPDGSKVSMSENATIIYDVDESEGERVVNLDGKAFFEVAHNPDRPFIVRTEESEIRVLGTSFLVDANTEIHETEVVVETGKVRVETLDQGDGNSYLDLNPGEASRIHASDLNKIPNYRIENQNYLSWKTKKLNFERSDLASVIEVLEDTYYIDIEFESSNASNCLLTAIYDNQDIDSIMEIVTATFDLKLTKTTQNSYRITGGGC